MEAAEPAQACRTRLRPGAKKPELAGPGRMRYLRPGNLGEGKASGWTVLIPRPRGAMVPAARTAPAGPVFSGATIVTVRATARARPSR